MKETTARRMKTTARTAARSEDHDHGAGLPQRHATRPRSVRRVAGLDPRLRLRRRRGSEIAAGKLTASAALDLLDDMLAIRELEEMIVRLRSGGYDPLPGYDYRGPDARLDRPGATSVGACARSAPTTTSPAPIAAHGDA